MTVVITIIAFGLIIAVHEFGHFIGARLVGIRVLEYSLGMGPAVAKVNYGGTAYSLRMLPLGGFVRMLGADPGDVAAAEPDSYLSQPVWRRMVAIVAGPAMNFVLAILLFSVVYGAIGVVVPTLEIAEVVPGLPAAEAGIVAGDVVREVNGASLNEWREFVVNVQGAAGRPLQVLIQRNGELFPVTLTPVVGDEGRGMVGVLPGLGRERFGLGAALSRGFRDTAATTVLWVRSLALLATGQAVGDVAGPVGIAQMIGWAAAIGMDTVLLMVALISVNVGLLNLLPIPVLDGSRLVFLALEGVRGRPIDPRYEHAMYLVGFAFLMGLAVLLTYRDLVRLITGGGG